MRSTIPNAVFFFFFFFFFFRPVLSSHQERGAPKKEPFIALFLEWYLSTTKTHIKNQWAIVMKKY